MPVPSVPFSRIAYLHGDAILHNMESMLLIERGILAFLRHNLDIQVIVVPLPDHADKMSGNAAPLVFRIDQHIVMYATISVSSSTRTRPTRRSPSHALNTVDDPINALCNRSGY